VLALWFDGEDTEQIHCDDWKNPDARRTEKEKKDLTSKKKKFRKNETLRGERGRKKSWEQKKFLEKTTMPGGKETIFGERGTEPPPGKRPPICKGEGKETGQR